MVASLPAKHFEGLKLTTSWPGLFRHRETNTTQHRTMWQASRVGHEAGQLRCLMWSLEREASLANEWKGWQDSYRKAPIGLPMRWGIEAREHLARILDFGRQVVWPSDAGVPQLPTAGTVGPAEQFWSTGLPETSKYG